MDAKSKPKPINYKIYSESRKEYFEFVSQRQMNIEFMKLLSLAHMCDVEVLRGEELFYNGPSPDEVALVEFAAS
jgi:phospholipid-transporting ATPase